MRNILAAALAATLLAGPATAAVLVDTDGTADGVIDSNGNAVADLTLPSDGNAIFLGYEFVNQNATVAEISLDDDDADGPFGFNALVGVFGFTANLAKLHIELLDGAVFSDTGNAAGFFSGVQLVQNGPSRVRLLFQGGEPAGGELSGALLDLANVVGGSFRVALRAEVPEPATFGLLGLAGLGLVAARRRRAA